MFIQKRASAKRETLPEVLLSKYFSFSSDQIVRSKRRQFGQLEGLFAPEYFDAVVGSYFGHLHLGH